MAHSCAHQPTRLDNTRAILRVTQVPKGLSSQPEAYEHDGRINNKTPQRVFRIKRSRIYANTRHALTTKANHENGKGTRQEQYQNLTPRKDGDLIKTGVI